VGEPATLFLLANTGEWMKKSYILGVVFGLAWSGLLYGADSEFLENKKQLPLIEDIATIRDWCRSYLDNFEKVFGFGNSVGVDPDPIYGCYRKMHACAIRLDEICQKKRQDSGIVTELTAAKKVCQDAARGSSFCLSLCNDIEACIVRLKTAASIAESSV